jgi:hypothetical protein
MSYQLFLSFRVFPIVVLLVFLSIFSTSTQAQTETFFEDKKDGPDENVARSTSGSNNNSDDESTTRKIEELSNKCPQESQRLHDELQRTGPKPKRTDSFFSSFVGLFSKMQSPLKNYLVNLDQQQLLVERNKIASLHTSSLSEKSLDLSGDLSSEMEKSLIAVENFPKGDLTESDLKEWPKLQEKPLKVYSTLLTDIKRGKFSVYRGNAKVLPSLHQNITMTPPQVFLAIFKKIKDESFKAVFQLMKKNPHLKPAILDENLFNDLVHKVIASRTQTFDPETILFVHTLRKEDAPHSALSGMDRIHYFKIFPDGKLRATTHTRFRLSDVSGDAPVTVGYLDSRRDLVIDLIKGTYDSEKITVKPILD